MTDGHSASVRLDVLAFERWLHEYGQAWQQGDPAAIVRLFADDAAYFEQPFDAPMVGLAAIHEYWSAGARDAQLDVRFSAGVLGISGATGIAHWRADFSRRANLARVELDGVLTAEFASDGRCTVFREWWHRRETAAQP